ncbi:hypothetical protein DERP_003622 [Dermatophagoides pteronyssinus]|uniref:DDE Tnp4 domain-containing protein n=1 Tax=Dermatophagoides pteronyssinus TaxID=6956 RepID=A0ABQ8JL64_DERPT|nr:hypothetical protein DERP_003622 [Dermatophagoides pteronyssinus]
MDHYQSFYLNVYTLIEYFHPMGEKGKNFICEQNPQHFIYPSIIFEHKLKRYKRIKCMSIILDTSNANVVAIHFLGPLPNGRNADLLNCLSGFD